jgi:hypothetical protein
MGDCFWQKRDNEAVITWGSLLSPRDRISNERNALTPPRSRKSPGLSGSLTELILSPSSKTLCYPAYANRLASQRP